MPNRKAAVVDQIIAFRRTEESSPPSRVVLPVAAALLLVDDLSCKRIDVGCDVLTFHELDFTV